MHKSWREPFSELNFICFSLKTRTMWTGQPSSTFPSWVMNHRILTYVPCSYYQLAKGLKKGGGMREGVGFMWELERGHFLLTPKEERKCGLRKISLSTRRRRREKDTHVVRLFEDKQEGEGEGFNNWLSFQEGRSRSTTQQLAPEPNSFFSNFEFPNRPLGLA